MRIGRQTAPESPAAAIAIARSEAAPAISASVHTGSPEWVTRTGRSSSVSGAAPGAGSSPSNARWRQVAAGCSSPHSSSASHSVPTSQPRLPPSASSSSGAACSTVAACASTRVDVVAGAQQLLAAGLLGDVLELDEELGGPALACRSARSR